MAVFASEVKTELSTGNDLEVLSDMELANKRILAAGADGFIGPHLTEMLVKKSAAAQALSLYNSFKVWAGWMIEIALTR